MSSDLLIIAGLLNLLAAALHVAIIIGGPNWYRFFGAGEAMATMAEQGSLKPTFITLGITVIFIVWSGYAWSGAGLLPTMPFLKWALPLMTAVYLFRGVGGLVVPFATDHPKIKQNSTFFWLWSSAACLVIGIVHLVGILAVWPTL